MDNQNANNGGFPQNPNPPQESNTPPATNNGRFENVRTQSVVESAREVAEKELAAQRAYNEQIIKEQQAALRRQQKKHAAVKAALIFLGIVIAIALIWLIIEIVKGINVGPRTDGCVNADGTISKSCCDREEYKNNTSCQSTVDPLPTINGYKCKEKNCKKMADIIENERIVIRDDKYIIYDIKNNETTATTIDNSISYISMSVFEWGSGKYYIITKPETGDYGLFSIDANQQIIPNKITRFYSDINHKAYQGMKTVLGKYIIVRESSQYRLYDIATGNELASAPEGIYVYDKYIMSYQAGGIRRVYNFDGKQILITEANDEVYVRDSFVVRSGRSIEVYNSLGERQGSTKNAVYKEIMQQKVSERANYLRKTSSFYAMPASRDYSD